MGEKKKFLIYDITDNEYYGVDDFIKFLTAEYNGTEITMEQFLNQTYVGTKFQAMFLNAMRSLQEQDLVEKVYINDSGDKVKLDGVDDLMDDIELDNTIRDLNNSVDEFTDLFDDERLLELDGQVNYIWENFNKDNENEIH